MPQRPPQDKPEKTPPAPRRSRLKRVLLWGGAGVLVVFVALAVCVGVVVVRPELLRPALISMAEAGGVALDVEELALSLSPPALRAGGVFVDTAPGSSAADGMRVRIRVAQLRVEVDPASYGEKGWITRVELDRPGVEVMVSEADEGAGATGAAGEGGTPMPWWRALDTVRTLKVTQGRVRVAAPWGVLSLTDFSAALAPDDVADAVVAGRPLEAAGNVSFSGSLSLPGTVDNGSPVSHDLLYSVAASFIANGAIAADGAVTAALAVKRCRVDSNAVTGDVAAQLELHLRGDALSLRTLDLRARDFSAGLPQGRTLAGLHADLTLEGDADLAARTFFARRLSVRLGEWVRFSGSLSGGPGGVSAATLTGVVPDAGLLLEDAKGLLPPLAQDLQVAGPVPFTAVLSGNGADAELDLEATPAGLSVRWPQFGLDALVGGVFGVVGPLGDLGPKTMVLEAEVTAHGDMVRPGLQVRGADVSVIAAGSPTALAAREVVVLLPAGGLRVGDVEPPLGAVELHASVTPGEDGLLNVEDVKLVSENMGTLVASGALDTSDLLASRGTARWNGVDLAAMRALGLGAGLLPETAPELEGTVDLEVAMAPEPAGPRVRLQSAFTGLGASPPDGAWLAGDVAGTFAATLDFDEPVRIATVVELTAGEALLGDVYLGGEALPLQAALTGAVHTGGGSPYAWSGVRGRVSLAGLGAVRLESIRLQREADSWNYGGRIVLEEADLPAAYAALVGEPLAFDYPWLKDLTVSGGVDAALAFWGRGPRTDVAGHVTLADVECRQERLGIHLEGLNLHLPLGYSFGVEAQGAQTLPYAFDPPGQGRLTCRRVTLPTGVTDGLELDVALAPNILAVDGEFHMPMYGGELMLGDLVAQQPLSSRFAMQLRAEVAGMQLGEFAPILDGRVDGVFPRITVTLDRADIEGGLAGTLFEGGMALDGLYVERPFSPGWVAGVDAIRVSAMNLEPLSAALDMGRVTGLLDITLDEMRMAYRQPEAFRLVLASTQGRGEKRKVSLKAVNSISVVGTGSGLGDIGVGVFTSFFKEFGYRELGIRCDLSNDVFIVRGLIVEGGVEYLIKKPMLFGINVVNGNPDNRISFSDMRKRIERVAESPSSPGGMDTSQAPPE